MWVDARKQNQKFYKVLWDFFCLEVIDKMQHVCNINKVSHPDYWQSQDLYRDGDRYYIESYHGCEGGDRIDREEISKEDAQMYIDEHVVKNREPQHYVACEF